MAAAPKVGVHGVYSGSAATVFPTGLGWCGIAWNNEAVRWVTLAQPTWSAAGSEIAAHGEIRERLAPEKRRLVERILAYSDGKCDDFLDIFLDFEDLTDFQREVLRACRQIPWGETRSYGQLAMLSGASQGRSSGRQRYGQESFSDHRALPPGRGVLGGTRRLFSTRRRLDQEKAVGPGGPHRWDGRQAARGVRCEGPVSRLGILAQPSPCVDQKFSPRHKEYSWKTETRASPLGGFVAHHNLYPAVHTAG